MIVAVVAAVIAFALSTEKPTKPTIQQAETDPYSIFQFIDFGPNKVFTKEELALYAANNTQIPNPNGKRPPLLLAILGKVFDVSKGARFYDAGRQYAFFTGRDGSRAYVTGEFNEAGLIDNLEGLTAQQVSDIYEWIPTYRKEYRYVGKLAGTFYDNEGKPLPAMKKVKTLLKKAKEDKKKDEEDKKKFPPCNSSWSKEGGSYVWCSNQSGGIARDWVGVPRQRFFTAGKDGTRDPMCVCVREELLNDPMLRVYAGCDPKATKCATELGPHPVNK